MSGDSGWDIADEAAWWDGLSPVDVGVLMDGDTGWCRYGWVVTEP